MPSGARRSNDSCCSKKKSVIGASSTAACGGETPSSRASITSAAARLPPAESPPTAIRVPSPPSVAPFLCIHRNTARQSSRHAGNGDLGHADLGVKLCSALRQVRRCEWLLLAEIAGANRLNHQVAQGHR